MQDPEISIGSATAQYDQRNAETAAIYRQGDDPDDDRRDAERLERPGHLA